MRELRAKLRELLPAPLRERYHRHALWRDFGIDRRAGKRRRTAIDPHRTLGLNLIGYFDSVSGVGQSARSLADAAEAAGVPVSRIEASAGKSGSILAPHAVNLYHVNADGAAAIVEELGPAVHAGRASAAYWYWESGVFPDRWRDRFDYFDEIWVASEFCRESIAAASPIPVVRVPPAVVAGREADAADARLRWGIAPSDFLFLTILDALSVPERKNPIGTVRAFARAFPAPGAARLFMLVANSDQVPDLVPELARAAGDARVRIHPALLARGEVEALLAASDAYVSLHRAEGFGLCLAEAMAIGKPVIATDYSGSADYLDESTGFPVRWRTMTLSRGLRDYDAGTRWAQPDEEHAVERLRCVFTNPDEARRRGEAARRTIAQRYDPGVIGRQVAARLVELRRRLEATA